MESRSHLPERLPDIVNMLVRHFKGSACLIVPEKLTLRAGSRFSIVPITYKYKSKKKNDVDHPGLGHNMGYDAPFKGELGLNPFHQGNETPRSSIKRPESAGVNDLSLIHI